MNVNIILKKCDNIGLTILYLPCFIKIDDENQFKRNEL